MSRHRELGSSSPSSTVIIPELIDARDWPWRSAVSEGRKASIFTPHNIRTSYQRGSKVVKIYSLYSKGKARLEFERNAYPDSSSLGRGFAVLGALAAEQVTDKLISAGAFAINPIVGSAYVICNGLGQLAYSARDISPHDFCNDRRYIEEACLVMGLSDSVTQYLLDDFDAGGVLSREFAQNSVHALLDPLRPFEHYYAAKEIVFDAVADAGAEVGREWGDRITEKLQAPVFFSSRSVASDEDASGIDFGEIDYSKAYLSDGHQSSQEPSLTGLKAALEAQFDSLGLHSSVSYEIHAVAGEPMSCVELAFNNKTALGLGCAAGSACIYITAESVYLAVGALAGKGALASVGAQLSFSQLASLGWMGVAGIAVAVAAITALLVMQRRQAKKLKRHLKKFRHELSNQNDAIREFFEADLKTLSDALDDLSLEEAAVQVQVASEKNQALIQKLWQSYQYAKKKKLSSSACLASMHALLSSAESLSCCERHLSGQQNTLTLLETLQGASSEGYHAERSRLNERVFSADAAYGIPATFYQQFREHHGSLLTFRRRQEQLIDQSTLPLSPDKLITTDFRFEAITKLDKEQGKKSKDCTRIKQLKKNIPKYVKSRDELKKQMSDSLDAMSLSELSRIKSELDKEGDRIKNILGKTKADNEKYLEDMFPGFAESHAELIALVDLLIAYKKDPDSVTQKEKAKIRDAMHLIDYENKAVFSALVNNAFSLYRSFILFSFDAGSLEAKINLGLVTAMQGAHAVAPFLLGTLVNLPEAFSRGEMHILKQYFGNSAKHWKENVINFESVQSTVSSVSTVLSMLNTSTSLLLLVAHDNRSFQELNAYAASGLACLSHSEKTAGFIKDFVRLSRHSKNLITAEEMGFNAVCLGRMTAGRFAAGTALAILPLCIDMGFGLTQFLATDYDAIAKNPSTSLEARKAWVWQKLPQKIKSPGHLCEKVWILHSMTVVKGLLEIGGGLLLAPKTGGASLVIGSGVAISEFFGDVFFGGNRQKIRENILQNCQYFIGEENFDKADTKLLTLGVQLVSDPGWVSNQKQRRNTLVLRQSWFENRANLCVLQKNNALFLKRTQINHQAKTVGAFLYQGDQFDLGIPLFKMMPILKERMRLEMSTLLQEVGMEISEDEVLIKEKMSPKKLLSGVNALIADLRSTHEQCFDVPCYEPTEEDYLFFSNKHALVRRLTAKLFYLFVEAGDGETANTVVMPLLYTVLPGSLERPKDWISQDAYCNDYLTRAFLTLSEPQKAYKHLNNLLILADNDHTLPALSMLIHLSAASIPLYLGGEDQQKIDALRHQIKIFVDRCSDQDESISVELQKSMSLTFLDQANELLRLLMMCDKKSTRFTRLFIETLESELKNSEDAQSVRFTKLVMQFIRYAYGNAWKDFPREFKKIAVVNFLLGRFSEDNKTLLMCLFDLGYTEIVDFILNHEFTVDGELISVPLKKGCVDAEGNSVLHHAVLARAPVSIIEKLHAKLGPTYVKNSAGLTVFDCILSAEHVGLLGALQVSLGEAFSTVPNSLGFLFWACATQQYLLCDAMMAKNPIDLKLSLQSLEPTLKDKLISRYGHATLAYFARSDASVCFYLFKALMRCHADNPMRCIVSLFAYTSVVQWLVTHDLWGLDQADTSGRTMLICSVLEGFYDTLAWLIGQGADVSIVDDAGNTAAQYARRLGDSKSMALLGCSSPQDHVRLFAPQSRGFHHKDPFVITIASAVELS